MAIDCVSCGDPIPTYEGGTVSDTDDVLQVVDVPAMRVRGASIIVRRRNGIPVSLDAIPRRYVKYIHGPCWLLIRYADPVRFAIVAMTRSDDGTPAAPVF